MICHWNLTFKQNAASGSLGSQPPLAALVTNGWFQDLRTFAAPHMNWHRADKPAVSRSAARIFRMNDRLADKTDANIMKNCEYPQVFGCLI